MNNELKSGRPLWALIGTSVLLLSFYFDSIGASGTSNVMLFTGCFIFGAVFQSISRRNKE